MPSDALVLGFDTSAAHCAARLWCRAPRSGSGASARKRVPRGQSPIRAYAAAAKSFLAQGRDARRGPIWPRLPVRGLSLLGNVSAGIRTCRLRPAGGSGPWAWALPMPIWRKGVSEARAPMALALRPISLVCRGYAAAAANGVLTLQVILETSPPGTPVGPIGDPLTLILTTGY